MSKERISYVVCVGKKNGMKVYVNINNVTDGEIQISRDFDCFDEKKYNRLCKKYENIFTVLGVTREENKDIRSFVLSDDNGKKRLVSPKFFIDLLSSGNSACMNYTLVNKDGLQHLRKNPNCNLKEYTISESVELVGSYKAANELSSTLLLSQLDNIMKNRGFKLGLSQDCEYSLLDEKNIGKFLIYYNMDGTLITFNWVNNDIEKFPATLKALRHTNSHKVKSSLRDKSYLFSNSIPIDGLDTDITYYNSNKWRTFFDFIEEMNKFSTPCKPYYVSKNLGGCFDILNINSQERREVDKKLREVIDIREEMGEITFGLFYYGYKKISRYPKDLQYFYSNFNRDFIENCKNYFIKKGADIKKIDKVISIINACF